MWDFTPFGLLMPSLAPMDKADPKLTEGKYDLQVRARREGDLRYFMDHYMVPGSFHDEIELTPNMDYNARFYTTKEGYADGMRAVIMDIDYKKFKPSAEAKDSEGNLKYGTEAETRVYHSVLNSIWGVVSRLGAPGGFYGPFSASNPDGYFPVTKYKGSYGKTVTNKYVPRTFGKLDQPKTKSYSRVGDELFPDFDESVPDEEWYMDYSSDKEKLAQELLAELNDAAIPVGQWEDYLTEHEFNVIRPHMQRIQAEQDRLVRKYERDARKARKQKARTQRRAPRGKHNARMGR